MATSLARAETPESSPPPVRVITHGPKHHWFGYYDKLEFDPTDRFVLSMEVDFQHRSPTPDDEIKIGMVDLVDDDRWIELGTSRAWCWQQGCMLQWVPQTESTILWNDRDGDHFVCRIMDVATRKLRTIPHPVYALHSNGKTAVSTSFSRLAEVRPGYGYAGVPDPDRDDPAPSHSGISSIDLTTGEQRLILSLAEVAQFGPPMRTMAGAKHKFNHLLYSPDGSRFAFLHRWTGPLGRQTRLLTAKPDGTDLRVVDDNGLTSHYWWRDPGHILALSSHPPYGMRFFLFEDGGKKSIEVVGADAMIGDGHCSYLPGGEWILNDTYPQDGFQYPYLYHPQTSRKVSLGRFRAPEQYVGEWRCDTHPRFSRDGKSVVIDAPSSRDGRQLHLIDVSGIVG
ncbi:hypothetical protein [Lacipirellula sp.]|uniref:hypothetical protein n=1 Tax=Lacipirellula sp. TaxID=2691419 RepID=UPI003D0D70F5